MNKKLITLVSMGLISMSLVSCSSNKKISEVVESTLNARYGESFKVDKVLGDGVIEGETEVLVYPINNKEDKFIAYASDDLSNIKDDYKSVLVGNQINEIVKKMAMDVFGEVTVYTPVTGEDTDTNKYYENISDYFADTRFSTVGINVFVKCYEDVEDIEQANRIMSFLNSYKELNYTTQYVRVYYVKEDVYDNQMSKVKDMESITNLFDSPANSYLAFKTTLADGPFTGIDLNEYSTPYKIMNNYVF